MRLRNIICILSIVCIVFVIVFFSTTTFVKKEFVGYKNLLTEDFIAFNKGLFIKNNELFAKLIVQPSCFLYETDPNKKIDIIFLEAIKHPKEFCFERLNGNKYVMISGIRPNKINIVIEGKLEHNPILTIAGIIKMIYGHDFRESLINLFTKERKQEDKLYETGYIISAPFIISLAIFLCLWYGILLYYDKRKLRWRSEFGYPKGKWGLLYRVYLPKNHEKRFMDYGINNTIQTLQIPKGNSQEKLIRKSFEIVDKPRTIKDFWAALKHAGRDWKTARIIEEDIEKTSKQYILEYIAEGTFPIEEKKQEYCIKYFWKIIALKPGQRKKYFMQLDTIPLDKLQGKKIADIITWEVSTQIEIKSKKINQTIDYSCLALSEVTKLRGDKILLKKLSESIKTKDNKESKDIWNFILYLKGKSYTDINNYIKTFLRKGVVAAIDSVVNNSKSFELIPEALISQENKPQIRKKLGRVLILGNGIDVYKAQYDQMLKEDYGATEVIFYTGDLFEQKIASAMPQINTAIIIAKRISHSATYKCKNVYGNENVLEISVLNKNKFFACLAENGY